ncbi:MAG: hypothetical protein ACJ72N_04455 [Labedaea sp.]
MAADDPGQAPEQWELHASAQAHSFHANSCRVRVVNPVCWSWISSTMTRWPAHPRRAIDAFLAEGEQPA